jgi:16S rRNA (uracil1498-N3)-methyltransferase
LNLFYQPEISAGISHLDAEESRHAVRVLRMSEGDPLMLTDGKGCFYSAKITKADPKKCQFEILDKHEAPRRNFHIHVAIAPTKNADRIELFVEKVTEIGIDEISFILCKNSERKAINMDRVKKTAVSAMKQSQQALLPKLNELVPFKKIVEVKTDQKFIGFVDSTNPIHLKTLAQPNKKYLILIGPEGDFSKEELELSIQNNFEKVSLGTNRLRTETAGLVAVQVLALANVRQ